VARALIKRREASIHLDLRWDSFWTIKKSFDIVPGRAMPERAACESLLHPGVSGTDRLDLDLRFRVVDPTSQSARYPA
jgi:hypothetical protein